MSQLYLTSGVDNPVLDVPNEVFCAHARPGEMLHLVLLGWFKYVLEESFSLAGPRSEAVKNFDSLRAKVGQLLPIQAEQPRFTLN